MAVESNSLGDSWKTLLRYFRVGDHIKRINQGVTALKQPLPVKLRSCMHLLLSSKYPGCLPPTPEVEKRLKRAAVLAEPYVNQQTFHEVWDEARWLHAELAKITLEEACESLRRLGQFARKVQHILAGPAAGEQRDWARSLLLNLLRLSQLADYVLGDTPVKQAVAVSAGQEPTTSPEVQAPPPPPAAEYTGAVSKPGALGDEPGSPTNDSASAEMVSPDSEWLSDQEAVGPEPAGTGPENGPPATGPIPTLAVAVAQPASQPADGVARSPKAAVRTLAQDYPVIAKFLDAVDLSLKLEEEATKKWPKVVEAL